jgi:putative flippase GtrA
VTTAVVTRGAGTMPAGPLRALAGHPLLGQLGRYAAVSGLATAVNAAGFLTLRTWWPALAANLVALALSTAVSTEVNRRFTFGGASANRWRTHLQDGGTVVFYAGYSSLVLVLLGCVVARPTPLEQTLAIVSAGVVCGVCRFLLLRHWVFDPDDAAGPEGSVVPCAGMR